MDGAVATERYWIPLHALLRAEDDAGHDVLAERHDAADIVASALAARRPVYWRRVTTRMLRGQRALIRLSYREEPLTGRLAWSVHVLSPNRRRREDPGEELARRQAELEAEELQAEILHLEAEARLLRPGTAASSFESTHSRPQTGGSRPGT